MTALISTGTPSATQHLLPATLNTIEKLLTWALLLFHRINSTKDILFTDGNTSKQIAYQRFYGQDGNVYFGFTAFIPLNPDYEVLPLKPWEYAVEMNNAVASSNYNS
jgi:hypothetical protein